MSVGFIFQKEYASTQKTSTRYIRTARSRAYQRSKTDERASDECYQLKSLGMWFKPIVLVDDEVPAVLAAMDKSSKRNSWRMTQIAAKGRSLGYLLDFSEPGPQPTSFLNRFCSQFTTKIRLGT